ncbi:MAG: sulfotransferase [Nitrosomonas sp.]|nr:sulfotransferase [Nitrosomonas sp.]
MSGEMNRVNNEAVFVIGLPRSGSTLLSRLLNNSPHILSVNDLYFIQAVMALNVVEGELSSVQMEALTDQLLSVVTIRTNASEEFIGQFQVAPARIQEIRSEVLAKQKSTPYSWYGLMNDLLGKVAESVGKSRWADKTPQNFFHFNLLAEHFPSARFIFLLRDPRSILASYKYSQGEGHDARRYHPVVYSLYWRSAIHYYMKVKDHPRVMMMRYEDMLSDMPGVCAKLEAFLGTEIGVPVLSSLGHNSSFSDGRRKYITPTENWICQCLCKSELNDLGYETPDVAPRVRDIPDLMGVSLKFAIFHTVRLFRDRDARKRITTFIRGLKGAS